MDLLATALNRLRFTIPIEILQYAFQPPTYGIGRSMYSLDELIMANVIRPRVMIDCKIVGGMEMYISMAGIPMERPDDITTVYRIPKSRTQGKSILSVLNITFSDPTLTSSYDSASLSQSTTMQRGFQAMTDAMGTIPLVSSAGVQLIAENAIMFKDNIVLTANMYLRCLMEDDPTMSHISIRSYNAFGELVEHAVKAHIYNTTKIRLDKGALSGGQELGSIKEVIDEYKDSYQIYADYLKTKWAKIAMINDREQYNRHLRTMVGSYR